MVVILDIIKEVNISIYVAISLEKIGFFKLLL